MDIHVDIRGFLEIHVWIFYGFSDQGKYFIFQVYTVLWSVVSWWKKNKNYRCTILAPEGGEDAGVCVMLLTQVCSHNGCTGCLHCTLSILNCHILLVFE